MKKQTLFIALSSTLLFAGCNNADKHSDEKPATHHQDNAEKQDSKYGIGEDHATDSFVKSGKKTSKTHPVTPQEKEAKKIEALERSIKDPELIMMVERNGDLNSQSVSGYDYDPKFEYNVYTNRVYTRIHDVTGDTDKERRLYMKRLKTANRQLKDVTYKSLLNGAMLEPAKDNDYPYEPIVPSYVTDKKTAERIMKAMKESPSVPYIITPNEDKKKSDIDPFGSKIKYPTIKSLEVYDKRKMNKKLNRIKSLKEAYVKTYGQRNSNT